MSDDIVIALRGIADDQETSDDIRAATHFLREVADEIERLRAEVDLKGYRVDDLCAEIERLGNLVVELLPFMINDMTQGMKIGPAPIGHSDDCTDCLWYESSRKWSDRLVAGEFAEFQGANAKRY